MGTQEAIFTVRAKCRDEAGLLGEQICSHDHTASGATCILAKSLEADSVPVVCADVPLSQWHRATVPNECILQHLVVLQDDSRLRSTESSLLVPSTCRTVIGDRAFPVAAARAGTLCCSESALHRRLSHFGWN